MPNIVLEGLSRIQLQFENDFGNDLIRRWKSFNRGVFDIEVRYTRRGRDHRELEELKRVDFTRKWETRDDDNFTRRMNQGIENNFERISND